MIDFTEEELQRYIQHILLQEVGAEGQERIRRGRVLVIGVGGLGSPVALYLAAAGVGTIGIADGDTVELSNLQLQVIHFTPDVGRNKVDSAGEKLRKINPHVRSTPIMRTLQWRIFWISSENMTLSWTVRTISPPSIINDACVLASKPVTQGGILRFEGQIFTHLPGTACYRCLFGEPPPAGGSPSCSQAGVLGAIAGILGSIQAAETLKYLTGTGELLTDRLLIFDARTMEFHRIESCRQNDCPLCGIHPMIEELVSYGQPVCDLKPHRNP